MKRCTRSALLPFALAACSSGGNDNDGGSSNPPPSAAMAIDAGNGLQVSRVAYQSAMASGDIAELAGDAGLTGNTGGGLFKPSTGSPGLVDTMLQVAIGPLELGCAVSGTVTITADFDDPTGQTLAAGDTITTTFSACDDGVGEVLNGTLDTEILMISGDILSGLYEMTMRMDLDNFQSTTDTDVLLANGDGTATINTLDTPYVEASVSGNSMLTDTNGSTETLTNYSSAQTVDSGVFPSPYTLLTSGTLDSTRLAGSVTYSTPFMSEGVDANYPTVGEMLIAGESSSARLIAQANGVDVAIQIFSNTTGTGTPESTINTTWTELAGL